MDCSADPIFAGQSALKSANWQAAKKQFENALREADTPEAHDGLGLALWWLNEISAAHEQRTLAYLGYKSNGDLPKSARLAAWLAREQVFLRANVSAMNGWFGRAFRLLEETGPCAEEGWVKIYHASMTAAPEGQEQIASGVIETARKYHDPDLEAFALAVFGSALVAQTRIKEGMNAVDEAMTAVISGEVRDYFVASETFCVTLSTCELAGDLVRTNHWCESALKYARRYQCTFLSAYCRTTYGSLLAETGRWQDAETALTEAIHTFDTGHHGLRVNAVLKLADLRVSQGRLEEAEVLLGGYEDYGSSVLPRARLYLAHGELNLAQAVLEQALQADPSPALQRAPLLRLLVDVLLAANDLQSARQRADELVTLSKLTGSNLFLAQAELALGQVQRYAGKADAVTHLRSALDHLNVHEGSLLACRVKLELARTLKDTDRAGAITLAKAALAGFERMGAAHEADQTQGLLREMGTSGKVSPRSHDQLLTRREEEVLELLAHGLSNREIASRLVVSAKTVEHHVSQVLGKLGLHHRAEAAAYFFRQPDQRSSPVDKRSSPADKRSSPADKK
ncbi:MAG TPA: LuxR C-terminal-related transcriptional regulator, partial [Anaerolineales bacterium]|nr:LuxR C-terminal-related transcriptional regulator [Anaerolineales bacterium]